MSLSVDDLSKRLAMLEQTVKELTEPPPAPAPLVTAKIAAKQLFDGTVAASTLVKWIGSRYRVNTEVFDVRNPGAKYAKWRFDVAACQRRDREYEYIEERL